MRNTTKNLHSKFEWRDPICVSHYPFPKFSPQKKELEQYLKLQDISSTNGQKALYVHIPFCESICSFCPFNKILKKEEKIVRYLKAVKRELNLYSDTLYGRSVVIGSIYFGGGTPSCLSAEQLVDLVKHIKKSFKIADNAQFTVEGSPSNFTAEKLKAIYELGVNRVSFGIQTFNNRLRNIIELSEPAEHNIEILKQARSIGYQNICIDLLYNIPGQTMKDWIADLQLAINLNIEHITLFSLCLVPGTPLELSVNRGDVPTPKNQDEEIDMFVQGREYLRNAGYIQYSVWDFAKPDKIDKHVQIYYTKQEALISTGPAAFGYINDYMYINKGNFDEYCQSLEQGELPILVGKKADQMDQMRGMMAKGLRLYQVDKSLFYSLFNKYPEEVFPDEISFLKKDGLIRITDESISLTDDGGVWGNNVSKVFFEEPETFEWRASLAKGQKPNDNSDDHLTSGNMDELGWADGIKELFERMLERKPLFIRNKSRGDITKLSTSLAKERNSNIIEEKDLIKATLLDTPAPYRPVAISGFRKFGVDMDKYLNKNGGIK